jgi:hypothetical protein
VMTTPFLDMPKTSKSQCAMREGCLTTTMPPTGWSCQMSLDRRERTRAHEIEVLDVEHDELVLGNEDVVDGFVEVVDVRDAHLPDSLMSVSSRLLRMAGAG